MKKTLVFTSFFFALALIFAPIIRGVSTTPEVTVLPVEVLGPTITSEITLVSTIEPEPSGIVNSVAEEGSEKKLDQKEIIGVILIGILIVIIIIQALWDKIKKPPTATSSEPE